MEENHRGSFSPKIENCFLSQAAEDFRAHPFLSVPAQAQILQLGDCEPELPGWSQCLSYLLSVQVLSPPPGLTMLSSFPVKADRAEGACVDAAPDTLGTTQCSHGLTTLHAPALPAY